MDTGNPTTTYRRSPHPGKLNTAKANTNATQREGEDHPNGQKAKKDKKPPNKTYARMVTGERKKLAK